MGKQHVGALVLAAGFSNRFGSLKLTATLDNGRTVFEQTMQRIQAAIPETVVVTRPELVEALLAYTDSVQVFDRAECGMGATLAYGIGLVSDWDACLVCLADMPFIHSDTYAALATRLDAAHIVIPDYQGRSGNPVGFGRSFFPELAQLSGDQGGRPLLRRHEQKLIRLAVDDAAVLLDIDIPDDLQRHQSSTE